jgi:hypothetical protein
VEAALGRPLDIRACYAGLGGAQASPPVLRSTSWFVGAAFSVPVKAALGWLLVAALGVPVRRGSPCRSRRRWTTRSGTAPVEAALGRFLVAAPGVPVATAA